MLIRPGNIAESYWIGAGVLLLLVLRLVNSELLRRGVSEAADVCFFLIGMMLLSELAREQGVFDWLSSVAGAPCRRIPVAIIHAGLPGRNNRNGLFIERRHRRRSDTGNSDGRAQD